MRAVQHDRRAASGLAILMILVLGAVMLGVVFYAGLKLGETKQAEIARAADADATVKKTSATSPRDDDEGYDEAAEEAKRRAAANQPGEHSAGTVPPISFDPPLLEFGVIPPGKLVNGTVDIHNNGTEPLFIEQSRASCSCTAVDMSNTWIQPGESVPMEATFTKQTLGTKKAAVRFKIRDYSEVVSIELTATVALPVLADPAYISAEFDPDTRQTLEASGEFTIRSIDDKPFRILAINGSEPNYISFNPAADEPQNAYRVAWDLSDVNDQTCRHADGSKLRRYWAIETDHPDCPVFDVQVRHQCTLPEKLDTRRWVVSPARLLLGELKPGESKEVQFHMKWLPRSGHNEQIYSVLPESPYVKVDVVDFERARGDGDEDTVRLRVKLGEEAPEGLLYDIARVHSQLHNSPLILIGRVAR